MEKIAPDTNMSYLTLRKWLGTLGLLLPITLIVVNGFNVKPSISHFYYSNATVVFTSFLFAFGIFLMSYRGRVGDDVKINDNWLTTIGGFASIVTACIPTAYNSACSEAIKITTQLDCLNCGEGVTTQYIHNNSTLGAIHLCSAAVFLILMGYMSFFRFTRGESVSSGKKVFYKICGVMVWLPIGFLGATFIWEIIDYDYTVLVCEWIALTFFGIAWMVKGKAFERFGL